MKCLEELLSSLDRTAITTFSMSPARYMCSVTWPTSGTLEFFEGDDSQVGKQVSENLAHDPRVELPTSMYTSKDKGGLVNWLQQ